MLQVSHHLQLFELTKESINRSIHSYYLLLAFANRRIHIFWQPYFLENEKIEACWILNHFSTQKQLKIQNFDDLSPPEQSIQGKLINLVTLISLRVKETTNIEFKDARFFFIVKNSLLTLGLCLKWLCSERKVSKISECESICL